MSKNRKSNPSSRKTPSPPPEPTATPVASVAPAMPAPTKVPAAASAPAPAKPTAATSASTTPVKPAAAAPASTTPAKPAAATPASTTPAKPAAATPAVVDVVPEPEPVAPEANPVAAHGASGASAKPASEAVKAEDASGESPAPKALVRVQFKEPAVDDFVSAPRFSADTTASTRGPTPARDDDSKKARAVASAKGFAAKELAALLRKVREALAWFLTNRDPRIRVARVLLLCVLSLNVAHLVTRFRSPKAIKA